ncbi:FRG domain-containing protein [Hyphomonas sp.]|uniref:FRG domain-containing protein n=1 Tax=Hyphomonas sp. TaxID=87 RepID=UPI003D2A2E55
MFDGIVVDRFYGGALSSANNRTRFSPSQFPRALENASSRVSVHHTQSLKELSELVGKIKSEAKNRLLFRGQTKNYALKRPRPNPNFLVDGIGEISLLPSVWRRVLRDGYDVLHCFQDLGLFEWSKIFYDQIDVEDIDRRLEILRSKGEYVLTMGDMEVCSDPIVRKFGRLRMDISLGHNLNLRDALHTLLQHYGLYSPVLDLTSELNVALFFATHRFVKMDNRARYDFVGTNDQQSVLYVFEENKHEMAAHKRERTFDALEPLRPMRQSCVVCRSDTYAMNLPADFLRHVLFLNFDLNKPLPANVDHLFPSVDDDRFLAALKKNLLGGPREFLTEF